MTRFYEPTDEQLDRLSSGDWVASYSGGKDSTCLVTWVEWLRRAGRLVVTTPRLVRSDTGVEDPALAASAEALTARLVASGWDCTLVRPQVHERLYCRILGLGLSPIHPGIQRMRWCTKSTKINPIKRGSGPGPVLKLTGLRLGESAMRDGKILKRLASGCAAGGECGIPVPAEDTYSPLLHWRTCQVVDWLTGLVAPEVVALLNDLLPPMQAMVDVYRFTEARTLWDEREIVSASRFGCIGCPAIGAEAAAPRSVVRRHGANSPLLELYDVWFEARKFENRVPNRNPDKLPGPIRMAVRPILFERVMDIQRRAGVVLVTPEDEAFIRQCWAEKRYPRGWSEADEARTPPSPPLFPGEEAPRVV